MTSNLGDTTPIVPRQRMHPAGIFVLAAGSVLDAIVPLVVAIFAFTGDREWAAVGALGFFFVVIAFSVLSIAVGAIKWQLTTFSVDARSVNHRSRFISVKETDIPIERVQSVDAKQNPIQRLFGVFGVKIRAAGGGKKAEISLQALSPEVLTQLRRLVAAKEQTAASSTDVLPKRKLSNRELIFAALTEVRLGFVLPILAVVGRIGFEMVDNEPTAGDMLKVAQDPTAWTITAIVVLVASVALLTLGTIIPFSGFVVERHTHRLRIQRGLFTRREAVIPVARIQAIEVRENLLRQMIGRVSIQVEVAGYANESAPDQTLFPFLRRSEISAFLKELLPEVHYFKDAPTTSPPRHALRRYLLVPLLIVIAPVPLLWIAEPLAGACLLSMTVPVAIWCWARWRAANIWFKDGFCGIRYRIVGRRTFIFPVRRLQSQRLSQNPLQRRADLVTLKVRVGAKGKAEVRHLDSEDAQMMWQQLEIAGSSIDNFLPSTPKMAMA